jgi:hypothetical protein
MADTSSRGIDGCNVIYREIKKRVVISIIDIATLILVIYTLAVISDIKNKINDR